MKWNTEVRIVEALLYRRMEPAKFRDVVTHYLDEFRAFRALSPEQGGIHLERGVQRLWIIRYVIHFLIGFAWLHVISQRQELFAGHTVRISCFVLLALALDRIACTAATIMFFRWWMSRPRATGTEEPGS